MAASACQSSTRFSQHQKLHYGNLSPIHSQEGVFSSPFMCLSPSVEDSDNSNIYHFPGSSLLNPPNPATSLSQFTVPSDTKAVYTTTVDVTDIAMQQPGPSEMADERPTTPPQTTSIPTSNVQEEQQPARTPSHRKVTHTPERHAIDGRQGETKRSQSRTPPSSGRSQSHRPRSQVVSVSRSSSVTRQRATDQPRRKSVAYNQFPSQPDRDLIALHRESCRLFEAVWPPLHGDVTDHGSPQQAVERTNRIPHLNRSATEPLHDEPKDSIHYPPAAAAAPEPSSSIPPSLGSSRSLTLPTSSAASTHADKASPGSHTLDQHQHQPSSSSAVVVEDVQAEQASVEQPHLPATVIDWTLPSTRKCEYEKIDRSNRGIRGVWRRFAPRWCQGGQQRVPFFVEGEGRNKDYEGSVRRFRMDVSDDEEGSGGGGGGGGDSMTVVGKKKGDTPFDFKVASTWTDTRVTANYDQHHGRARGLSTWARPRLRRRNTEA